jgi:putative SOS response-associated peptidase YedK
MCGRYVSPEEAAIARAFRLASRASPFPRRFNVCPTDTVPFVRARKDTGEPEIASGRWGLVPHWWKEAKPPRASFNARVEEIEEKPMWRDAFARARCLVPAEGWYEWGPAELADPATGEIRTVKQPHYIRRADGALACFAGIAAWWKDPNTGEALRSCAILTAPSSGALAAIHGRTPLVLPESAWGAWLDRALTDPAKARATAAHGLAPDVFVHWPVRTLVNEPGRDGPELIEPHEPSLQR